MSRNIVKFTLALALTAAWPVCSMAVPAVEIIDQEIQVVTVVAEDDGTLRVTGANGQTLHVYNVAGVLVKSVKIDLVFEPAWDTSMLSDEARVDLGMDEDF